MLNPPIYYFNEMKNKLNFFLDNGVVVFNEMLLCFLILSINFRLATTFPKTSPFSIRKL